MVTTDGKIKVKECEVHHVPGLPVDLVPLQIVMKTSREGWFKINGEKALLEFSDGSLVAAPFDHITRLPMFHFFDDAEAAAVSLETALHARVSKESNQNLTCAKKEMSRWHWRLGHPSMALVNGWLEEVCWGIFQSK